MNRSLSLFIAITSILVCLPAASGASRSRTDEPKPEVLTARQILDRVAKTYAACKTYRDTGLVKTHFVGAGIDFELEKPFTTAFVRPDRVRFEYEQKERNGRVARHLIWRSGEEVRSWWDVMPGVKKQESLALALAEATGVSGGSAHTVPALLLPNEVRGWRVTQLTDAKRLEDAEQGGRACFRVEGKAAAETVTLWIDEETFLVRRIDTPKTIDVQGKLVQVAETTTYDPVADGPITDESLQFDPPAP